MKDNKHYANFIHRSRHSGGWSLITTLIGGAVVSVLAIGGTVLYDDYKQDLVAQGRGKQLGSGLDQLEAYGKKYQTALSSGSSVAGVANAAAPTTAELRALGFAAPSFDDAAQPGGPMTFRISREPAGCAPAKCVLHLTAMTSGSVIVAGKVDESFARLIAGYVPNGAGWSNVPSNPLNLTKKGIVLPNPLGNTPAVVAAKAWLGNSQSSQTVPPATHEYRNNGCPSGYTGYYEEERTITTDKWGNTSTGPWVTIADYCEPEPPPPPPTPPATTPTAPAPGVTCWEDSWPNNYTCPAGTSGSWYSTTYRTCPAGPYGADYTYEGPQTNTCAPSGSGSESGTSTPPPVVPPPPPTPTPPPVTTPPPPPPADPIVCSYEEISEPVACPRGASSNRIDAYGYNVCYQGGRQVSSTPTGSRTLVGKAYCDPITGEVTDYELY